MLIHPPDHLLERPTRTVDAPVRLDEHVARMLDLLALAPEVAEDVGPDVLGLECEPLGALEPARAVRELVGPGEEARPGRVVGRGGRVRVGLVGEGRVGEELGAVRRGARFTLAAGAVDGDRGQPSSLPSATAAATSSLACSICEGDCTHQQLLQPSQLTLEPFKLGGILRPDRRRYARELDLELREELVGLVEVGRDLAEERAEGLWKGRGRGVALGEPRSGVISVER